MLRKIRTGLAVLAAAAGLTGFAMTAIPAAASAAGCTIYDGALASSGGQAITTQNTYYGHAELNVIPAGQLKGCGQSFKLAQADPSNPPGWKTIQATSTGEYITAVQDAAFPYSWQVLATSGTRGADSLWEATQLPSGLFTWTNKGTGTQLTERAGQVTLSGSGTPLNFLGAPAAGF